MKSFKYLCTGILLFTFNTLFAQQNVNDKPLDKAWLASIYAKTGKTEYKGKQLKTIGMPIGGIAAGQLYIRGDGTLAEWWIANNAYNTGTGANPPLKTPLGLLPVNYSTFTPASFIDQGFKIKIKSGDKIFEKELNKNGFDNISFSGEYPIAEVKYQDVHQKLPISIIMQAFSPFIPLDSKESATPGTYLIFTIKNNSKIKTSIDLSGWLQNPVCLELKDKVSGSSRNRSVNGRAMQSLIMDMVPGKNEPSKKKVFDNSLTLHPYFGNVALSVLDKKAVVFTDKEVMATTPATKKLGDKLTGEIITSFNVLPGEHKKVVFMLTWYFPNRPAIYGGGFNWGKAIPTDGPAIGNMYANWYSNALDVANWLQVNRPRLTELTFRFHKSYYENTNLPYWLKQRIMMPVSTLATETSQWWSNDKFWAWEGVGSCPGTCTHVWNYEQALAHLFPDLEQNIRERTDFSTSFTTEGAVLTRNGNGGIRIDGHIGTILKSYRESLNSDNSLFLNRNWENIKKAARYAIAQDAADGSIDGIIQNAQANTYDVDFYGANTFVGGLYLTALKACNRMALQINDKVFADSCEAIFKSGSRLTVNKLWNGKYFIQDTDLKQHSASQYADGCLSDQLFGQTWAHLLKLGYIYPEDKIKTALKSIWKYNWTRDVGEYNKNNPPERPFALSGDPGLFNCTWPVTEYPNNNALPYKSEVWSGVEYQVATNMIYEGMIDEGLSIVKGINDRYSPDKHNPWNEIECGDHYARALASWGVLLALEDYYYDGQNGILSFAPKIQQDNFNGFFTTAKCWGNLVQTRAGNKQVNEVQVAYGKLHLTAVGFKIARGAKPVNVSLNINGKPIKVKWKAEQQELSISGIDEWLSEGDHLQVSIIEMPGFHK